MNKLQHNLRKLLSVAALVAGAAVFNGYGTESGDIIELEANASKKAVRAVLGAPTIWRGVVRNDYGQLVEVWEYWDRGAEGASRWSYFVGDKLVQLAAAGDWSEERQRITSTRFSVA